jgi:hypothetical protein
MSVLYYGYEEKSPEKTTYSVAGLAVTHRRRRPSHRRQIRQNSPLPSPSLFLLLKKKNKKKEKERSGMKENKEGSKEGNQQWVRDPMRDIEKREDNTILFIHISLKLKNKRRK